MLSLLWKMLYVSFIIYIKIVQSVLVSEVYDKVVPKTSKANRTWTERKCWATEFLLKNSSPYMSHLNGSYRDLQALKSAEICSLVKKRKIANFIINTVIYLDVLVSIKRLVVSLQQEVHNQLKGYLYNHWIYINPGQAQVFYWLIVCKKEK